MQEFKLEVLIEDINELNGILYEDIKDLLDSKENIENVLFTTKLIFSNNEELVEFMNKLMQFGYEDMAFDYVEHIYDKAVFDFSKLKTYENSNK
jgi:nitrate reductase assembly molybdenum cofactor insertion protein NarJ